VCNLRAISLLASEAGPFISNDVRGMLRRPELRQQFDLAATIKSVLYDKRNSKESPPDADQEGNLSGASWVDE
jgi:hypothetical protein